MTRSFNTDLSSYFGGDVLEPTTTYTPKTILIVVPVFTLNLLTEYNVTQSCEKFCALVAYAVARLFPDAYITVDWSMFQSETTIVLDGDGIGVDPDEDALIEGALQSIDAVIEDALAGRHGVYLVY